MVDDVAHLAGTESGGAVLRTGTEDTIPPLPFPAIPVKNVLCVFFRRMSAQAVESSFFFHPSALHQVRRVFDPLPTLLATEPHAPLIILWDQPNLLAGQVLPAFVAGHPVLLLRSFSSSAVTMSRVTLVET